MSAVSRSPSAEVASKGPRAPRQRRALRSSFYGLCQQVDLRIEAVETEFVEWDPQPLSLLLHKGEDLDISHLSSLIEHLVLSRLCSCDLARRLLAGFADEVAEIPWVVRVRLAVLGGWR